jgi:hypothetical protein
MHHTNEDHTANAKRSCVTFATRGIPDKESSAGGSVVLDASGSICCKDRFKCQDLVINPSESESESGIAALFFPGLRILGSCDPVSAAS